MFSLNIPVELTLAIAGKGKKKGPDELEEFIYQLIEKRRVLQAVSVFEWSPPSKKKQDLYLFSFSYNISTLPSDIATSI